MRDEQPLDDPLLGDLLAEMRSWGGAAAPAPSEALATLLAADPTRPIAGEPAPPPQPRRKKMMVSKLAALGLAAKAALGVGVAAAAVTTVGATGVLPDAAQHGVAVAVEAVTPFQLPDPLGSTTTTTTTVAGTGGAAVGGDTDGDNEDGAGGTGQPANHGACVSAIAKDKSVTGREHGQAVSAVARSDCGKDAATTGTTLGTTTASTSTTSTTVVGTSANRGAGAKSGNGNSGNGNSGNGNGNGGGNSGRG
ncbi:MAG: hypothetical protein ACRD2W_18550 [Acidimicrobiales bacterium]